MYIPYKTDIYIYTCCDLWHKFHQVLEKLFVRFGEHPWVQWNLASSHRFEWLEKLRFFRGQISFSALKQSWPENHHLRSVLAIIVPLKKLLDGSTPRLLQRKEMSKTELGSQTWWVVNAYGWNPIRMFWNTRFATYWAFVKDLIHQSMFSGKFGRHKISEASTGKPPKEVKGLPGNGKGERLQGRRPASLVVYCLQ